MGNLKLLLFLFVIWGSQLYAFRCQICQTKNELSGEISDSTTSYSYEKCWLIPVPSGHFIRLKIISMSSKFACYNAFVNISVADEEYKICSSDSNKNPITALSNVTVTFQVNGNRNNYYTSSAFHLKYNISDIECSNPNSFRCDNHSCISQTKVCDGVKDCKNGADEVGCETGVLAIKGVEEARRTTVSWLKSRRTPSWGWKEHTARAVVALYLASDVTFDGKDLEEELMAKQAELKTAVALLRSSLTNSELSMFVNALLVTCHNPRHFYGHDLVKRLKGQVEQTRNFTHPLAYLALCNANETWPHKAASDLKGILDTNSKYPFVKDLQAMAVMAFSCVANKTNETWLMASSMYQDARRRFKQLQLQDGSFGNVYTTSLITQALIASGQEHSKDWNLDSAMQYLMKELNSTSIDFLSAYLTLPILNGKSLVDISKINCSTNPRKHGDDPISEISDYLGPKMRVQYSLYIGDEEDVVHTIALRVPENYTASEVMELAQVEDPKYRFKWKEDSGAMYVYQIANVTNDPEAGKFWLLYVGEMNNTESLTNFITSPDVLTMSDGDHLVMWYKTASF